MAKTFNINPWQVGDEITAQRLNETGNIVDHPDFIELDHNVLQLYLENYFSGKITPFQGLFFDGFSDTNKTGAQTNTSVDTANKRLILSGSNTSGNWTSILTRFQQAKLRVYTWLTRKITARYNLKAAITQGATSLQFDTDNSDEFANGDSIDVYDANNTVRERKTVTNKSASSLPTVQFDTAGSAESGSGDNKDVATTLNLASQPNRIMVVFAGSRGTQRQINNVTVGGAQAINTGFSADAGAFGTFRRFELWYLVNPPSGNVNVNVNYSTSNSGVVYAMAFYNAAQVNPFRQVLTNQGSGNSSSRTVTSTVNDMAVDIFGGDVGTITVGPGQTVRISQTEKTSTEPGGASSTVMSWTASSSGGFIQIAASIKPAQSTVTLDFTPSISNAGGFGTTAFAERVDVLPKNSLVNQGDADNFVSPTYQESILDVTNLEVEDQYMYEIGTAQEDFKVKLDITRNVTSLTPYAKRLGCVFQES